MWIITIMVKNFKKSFEKIVNIMLIILYKDSDRNIYEKWKWYYNCKNWFSSILVIISIC